MKTTQLVKLHNGVPMTSSLQIAEVFDKQHKDVLRDIRAMECSSDFQGRNFALSFYISKLHNGGSKKQPLIFLTKDGFTFLVMGFTGKVAAQFKEDYINAFNKMEQKLKQAHPLLEKYKSEITGLKQRVTFAEKRTEDVLKLTKARIEGIKADYDKTDPLRPAKFYQLTEEYYNVLASSFKVWVACENIGSYMDDIRDGRLIKRFEAARLLYHDSNRRVPFGVGHSFNL